MIVRPLTAGMRVVDTNTKLSLAHAQAIKAAGIDAVVRYLSLRTLSSFDLDELETNNILEAGLGLGLVQHCRAAGTFFYSAEDGERDGLVIPGWAARAGIRPANLNDQPTVHYDMEGPAPGQSLVGCQGYDGGWCHAVDGDGFMPAGYFGYGLPMSLTPELLWAFKVKRYWKSGSNVVTPAHCGFYMFQDPQFNQTVGGVEVDSDGGPLRGHGVTGDGLGRFGNFLWAA